MKRNAPYRSDPRLGRWLHDLAHDLVREGTQARHALEARLNVWDVRSAMSASAIEASIRALFAGTASVEEGTTADVSRTRLPVQDTVPNRYSC
jgi:hypothetical protein